jgi:phage terminase large subunit-like protein
MLFSAQYQQAPEPAGGKIIKRKMLQYYNAVTPRPTDRIIMSWDIALSEKEAADYSACVVLLNRGDLYFVIDVIRGNFPFDRLKDKIIEVKHRYGRAAALVIEESNISYGLIQNLRREQQLNIAEYKPRGDKAERLISQIDLFMAARFCCSRTRPGSRSLSPSCCRFPAGMTIRSTR